MLRLYSGSTCIKAGLTKSCFKGLRPGASGGFLGITPLAPNYQSKKRLTFVRHVPLSSPKAKGSVVAAFFRVTSPAGHCDSKSFLSAIRQMSSH